MKELLEYEEQERKRYEINLKHLSNGVRFIEKVCRWEGNTRPAIYLEGGGNIN